MTAPNIVDVTTINSLTDGYALTTTLTTQLLDGITDKVLRINLIQVSNVDGTNDADVTITYYDGTTGWELASEVTVPAKASLVVLGNGSSLNLEEGAEIRGGASANSDLECIISYDTLDDA